MKTFLPAIILTNLYILFLICVFMSPAFLPERFATSFNAAGEPECWMNRSSYMLFVSGMGSLGLLVVVLLGFVIRFMPDKWVNIPRREYWLAPHAQHQELYLPPNAVVCLPFLLFFHRRAHFDHSCQQTRRAAPAHGRISYDYRLFFGGNAGLDNSAYVALQAEFIGRYCTRLRAADASWNSDFHSLLSTFARRTVGTSRAKKAPGVSTGG